jgi:hypothetical protein
MKEKGKYIGINQRVPLKVLNNGIIRLLDSNILSVEEFKHDMYEFTKGENRVRKGSKYAFQILSRPEIMKTVKTKFNSESFNLLSYSDKQALVLCLVAITFPITYDLLLSLSTAFKVQPQINRALINFKMSALYGSNRTLDIALDALIPMIIEMGTIKRTRISIYEIEQKKVIGNPFISELLIYTDIKLSSSKTILVEDLQVRPWYMYFLPEINIEKLTILKHSESRLGGGYLGIK